MPRISPPSVLAAVVLAGLTIWLTSRAKSLEQDLDSNSSKLALVGKPAPDFHLPDIDNHTVSLADYHGKRLVLAFGASWNMATPPAALNLAMFYKSTHEANSDWDLALITEDENRSAAQEFVSKSHLPFPVLLDQDRSTAKAFQIRRIPSILIVDASGKVTYGSTRGDQGNAFSLAHELGVNYQGPMGGPNAGRRD